MKQFESLLAEHGRAVLCFSAGKDSLACLEMLRPYLDHVTLAWVDAGATHPQVQAYMDKVRGEVPNFQTIRGNQPQSIETFGWPVDVLPVRKSLAGTYGAGPAGITFQPYTECCARSMWKPMSDFLRASGHTLVITGQRREESLRNRSRDEVLQEVGGVTYYQPLNDWSTDQVLEWLDWKGLPLPPFYAEGAESSADCWNCTAYLDHNQGRLRHMQRTEPEAFQHVAVVLTELQRQIQAESFPLNQILET